MYKETMYQAEQAKAIEEKYVEFATSVGTELLSRFGHEEQNKILAMLKDRVTKELAQIITETEERLLILKKCQEELK